MSVRIVGFKINNLTVKLDAGNATLREVLDQCNIKTEGRQFYVNGQAVPASQTDTYELGEDDEIEIAPTPEAGR